MTENLLDLFLRVLNANYITLPETDASFCSEKKGNALYIYFEHSNGEKDWRNNFDFPAKPYREMENKWYVHRGFLRVWKSAKKCLGSQICDRSVKRIIVAGYSHGAALALLCYEFCVFNRPDIASNICGYGYGCPRVVFGCLKRDICERFKNFYVIRNCKDLVTHVPPAFLGFRHVGNIIHIGKRAKYGPIDSHRPENHIEQLEKLNESKTSPQIKPLPCPKTCAIISIV